MHITGVRDPAAGLNPSQREAVTAAGGSVAVYAGPGSGKTTVLTRRVQYLIGQGIPKEKMMVVTFTRAAAGEMENRLVRELGESMTGLTIGTFHSIFLRLLAGQGLKLPPLLKEFEQHQLIRRRLEALDRPADEEAVTSTLGQIGYCKGNGILPEYMKVKKEKNIAFRRVFQEYEKAKQERESWDYDDILLAFWARLRRLSTSHPQRNRFLHILVDEFQDINRVQFESLRLLLPEEGALFAVGDDDQSIYGFRGSDPGYLLGLEERFPGCRRVILSTNYRSTEEVIRLGQRLIRNNRHRRDKQLSGTDRRGPDPQWMEPGDEEEEAEQIRSALRDGMETAVLYRTSTQARAVIDVLVREKIPFSVAPGDASFYRRWQVMDVLAYLKLAEDPDDLDSLVRIINKPKRYLFGEDWLDEAWMLSRKGNDPLLKVLPRMKNFEPYKRKYLSRLAQDVESLRGISAREAVDRIRHQIGYDRFLTACSEDLGIDGSALREPVEELSVAAASYADGPALLAHAQEVERVVREQRSRPQVRLMTFHRAKGLEFDRVFLIGLHAMVLPHRRSLQVPEQRKNAAWEEERRLLYVGMTRARRELVLSISQTRQGRRVGPSPFLREIGYDHGRQESAREKEAVSMSPPAAAAGRPSSDQPHLRFREEGLTHGTVLRHNKWGRGEVIRIEMLQGATPGRKVHLRFTDGTHTLHYELSRQLGLLHPEDSGAL
ncbi:ATP-dependent helicase [Paludifilum halophilum]|uniref:DNA 3'-5' helicase n=1 Tax=Paludifilum halophilum TaxID=1642702 RepID=A0A235BBS1_9BACL|nr:ATP-dependent helicase [Paludifilum halophilum]OYD09750.1 hypothetical protein CHM34_01785 [Paludifilum halophilum]